MFDKGNTSVRDDRWRYLRYTDGSEELYDLQNDQNEWTNLAADHNHEAAMTRMRKELKLHLNRLEKSRR